MANSGPNTNGSQFFIVTGRRPCRTRLASFGRVVKGLAVARRSRAWPTRRRHQKPIQPVWDRLRADLGREVARRAATRRWCRRGSRSSIRSRAWLSATVRSSAWRWIAGCRPATRSGWQRADLLAVGALHLVRQQRLAPAPGARRPRPRARGTATWAAVAPWAAAAARGPRGGGGRDRPGDTGPLLDQRRPARRRGARAPRTSRASAIRRRSRVAGSSRSAASMARVRVPGASCGHAPPGTGRRRGAPRPRPRRGWSGRVPQRRPLGRGQPHQPQGVPPRLGQERRRRAPADQPPCAPDGAGGPGGRSALPRGSPPRRAASSASRSASRRATSRPSGPSAGSRRAAASASPRPSAPADLPGGEHAPPPAPRGRRTAPERRAAAAASGMVQRQQRGRQPGGAWAESPRAAEAARSATWRQRLSVPAGRRGAGRGDEWIAHAWTR